jgi:hypothetical protein
LSMLTDRQAFRGFPYSKYIYILNVNIFNLKMFLPVKKRSRESFNHGSYKKSNRLCAWFEDFPLQSLLNLLLLLVWIL